MTMNTIGVPQGGEEEEVKRRDFLVVAGNAFAAVGAAATLWPFIDSMNPSSDVSALASTQIDLGPIALGQRITVMWQGKPVFIDHRTSNQIALAKADDGNAGLIDPATDASGRVPGRGVGVALAALRARSPQGDWRATPREAFSPRRPQV